MKQPQSVPADPCDAPSDADPEETSECLDALDSVLATHGKVRAQYLLHRLAERAVTREINPPRLQITPYCKGHIASYASAAEMFEAVEMTMSVKRLYQWAARMRSYVFGVAIVASCLARQAIGEPSIFPTGVTRYDPKLSYNS